MQQGVENGSAAAEETAAAYAKLHLIPEITAYDTTAERARYQKWLAVLRAEIKKCENDEKGAERCTFAPDLRASGVSFGAGFGAAAPNNPGPRGCRASELRRKSVLGRIKLFEENEI